MPPFEASQIKRSIRINYYHVKERGAPLTFASKTSEASQGTGCIEEVPIVKTHYAILGHCSPEEGDEAGRSEREIRA